jgi:DNA mismatch repair ATPase MutS
VPGASARLFVPDRIFTHFEREEDLDTLASKLEEELQRMHAMFDDATGNSVIVLNEIFNSTTVQDATELSSRVLTDVSELDALCVCVTFIDELSVLNDKVVSMVSTVDPDDPAVRTFKVVRRAADGRAYAMAIARKYDLTYEALSERLS